MADKVIALENKYRFNSYFDVTDCAFFKFCRWRGWGVLIIVLMKGREVAFLGWF
jgi:hypothetical protein